MRRILILAAALLAIASTSVLAAPIRFGVGAFGGVSYPVLNEASKQGAQYGVRVPIHFTPLFTLEPYYTGASLGDAKETVGGIEYTRDGGDVTGFGVNGLVTFGVATQFYPWGGFGSYTIKRTGVDDIKKSGWQAGLGLGFKLVPSLMLHIRGGLDVVSTDGTSQKFAEANLGLDYSFPF